MKLIKRHRKKRAGEPPEESFLPEEKLVEGEMSEEVIE